MPRTYQENQKITSKANNKDANPKKLLLHYAILHAKVTITIAPTSLYQLISCTLAYSEYTALSYKSYDTSRCVYLHL